MALVRLNTDQNGSSGQSDTILPARSSLLKEIQDVLGDEKISNMSKDELVALSGNCKKAIAQWQQRAGYMEPLGTRSLPTTPRSSMLSNKAGERDGNRCVLTKDGCNEGCHIFPYTLGKNMDKRAIELWSVLEMFWGVDETAKCQEILFGPSRLTQSGSRTLINRLENLITLSPGAHVYWSHGVFALKHISGGSHEGTTHMVLELHWQPKHPELDRLVRADEIVDNKSVQQLEDSALIDMKTRQEILSGYQVTLSTADAVNHPLPDERLIILQWLLTRVLRMSGAGEDLIIVYDDSPMASLVSSRAESLASRMELPAASPLNLHVSPAMSHPSPKQSHRGLCIKIPKSKWVRKFGGLCGGPCTRAFRGRQKLNSASVTNDHAPDGGVKDVML